MRRDRDGLLVALTVAIVLATEPGRDSALSLLILLALVGVLALAVRSAERARSAAIVLLVMAGVVLRVGIPTHGGSDVLDVVVAGIRLVQFGGNPYGIGFDVSRPPGGPFPYGPLDLLVYAPSLAEPWKVELLATVGVMLILAVRARLLGLAIYALAPTLIQTSVDGSNDNTLGLAILVSFALARRWPVAGAVGLAIATGLKPYAAAWAPGLMVWGGWPVVAAFLGTSLVAWSPVLLFWGVGNFLKSLDLANEVHHSPYWSLAALYQSIVHKTATRQLFDTFRLVLGAATALVSLPFIRRTRSLDLVIVSGALVFAATLFGGYWGTFAYFGALAPVLCWRIDDWLGLESVPLVGPGAEAEADENADRELEPQLPRDSEATP